MVLWSGSRRRRLASLDLMSVLLPILQVSLAMVEAAVAAVAEALAEAAVAQDSAQELRVWPGCKRRACC
jgi:hypothetical protein